MGRSLLVLGAWLFLFPTAAALAQANIKPDSTLRLPTPPGSELSVENKAFIDQALAAAAVEAAAGRLVAQKARNDGIRSLGAEIAGDQQALRDELTRLSEAKGYKPQDIGTIPELAGLRQLSQAADAEFDQRYLAAQHRASRWLFALYQTEMAATQDLQLRVFAAKRELLLRRHLESVQTAADAVGLRLDTPKTAPQY